MSAAIPAAEARAERQEWDRLMQRRRVLAPEDRCFCGSIEDLRRYVADLEARRGHHPSQHHQHKQEHHQHKQEHHQQEHGDVERELADEEIEP